MTENCYQIIDVQKDKMHAGSKAPADISRIARKSGYRPLYLRKITERTDCLSKCRYEASYLVQWNRIRRIIKKNSIILLQIPFYGRELGRLKTLQYLKRSRHCRFIAVVHDIMGFRQITSDQSYELEEYQAVLHLADVLIVHNPRMKEYFVRRGFPEKSIVCLRIFDYLSESPVHKVQFERSVTIAGNLSPEKSLYLGQLKELDLRVHLYGVNFDKNSLGDHIQYHGAFPAEEIPSKLDRGFGLVWDGDSLDSCSGPTGEYLRINNPHKLSLYLTSGLPVVIWDQAAEAEYVLRNEAGIAVSSLWDLLEKLREVTPEQYAAMSANAHILQKKLRSGCYTRTALREAVQVITGKRNKG